MATVIYGDYGVRNGIGSMTAVNASGTYVDFVLPSMPEGFKRITVMFNGVSSSGSSHWLIRIGSGSVESTGYSGASSYWSAGVATATDTTGFPMYQQQPSYIQFGAVSIFNVGVNTWVASGILGGSAVMGFSCTGTKTLSGNLDRIRITTVNGTDVFDAGTINVLYE